MSGRAVALFALLVVASTARGQPLPPIAQRLYVQPGALLGSTRIVALGGAYTGIAEGVSGLSSNFAALAHKRVDLDRDWDLAASLTWLDVPLGDPRKRDLDNDGSADSAQSTFQFLAGLMLQYGRFGVGTWFRSNSLSYCTTGTRCEGDLGTLDFGLNQAALAVSAALGEDDLILAFGLYATNGSFTLNGAQAPYAGNGTSFDILYRPHRRWYRLGVTLRPQINARYQGPTDVDAVLLTPNRRLYAAVASPSVLSLGASFRLGKNASLYNRLSPAGYRAAMASLHDGDPPPTLLPPDTRDAPWLLTAQLDLLAPVEDAVNLLSFVSASAPLPVGGATYFAPRVGVEHETIPDRLRLRGGSYVEPSVFAKVGPRVHATAGLELFLLRYYEDWSLSGSIDVASRYLNVGVSLGFWR